MSKSPPKNLAASVKNRLLKLSRERNEVFDLVLWRYCSERLLYRITQSAHAKQFVLKGAMLFAVWTERMHRPTLDIDLLGLGADSGDVLTRFFKEICAVPVEADGLVFDTNSVRVTEIREDQEYHGQRIQLRARLGKAKVRLQVDIGFGDVVTPEAKTVEYPTLLDFPAPSLRAYPKETVVSEKVQAMVALGILNSRMKDFYDVWTMSQEFKFGGKTLARAIRATFDRRKTLIPRATPVALTEEFAKTPEKVKQWNAFLSKNKLDVGNSTFPQIIAGLNGFLAPPLSAIAEGIGFTETWPPKGPWRK